MALGFIISWLLNFVSISIILAVVDEYKNYYLEKKPWFLFTVAIVLPTILELVSFLLNGKPFLSLLLPSELWGWIFG
ncbi:MAG: hypothetical protein J7L23_01695 [Candidatus Diapherotrites archaeon]|nr:hypothetical protein [Candidatus Diapherotrites archaeon]